MCGRFVITSTPEVIRQIFGYPEQPNSPPRYNIAPTQPIPVVIVENGARHFRLMRWGFLPSWVKDPRNFTLLINARAETAVEKPAFRNAMKRRRCLVPADGYYEWQTSGKRKQPYFMQHRDRQPIGFAALAETWIGPNGEEVDTVALMTAAAPADLAFLHHRVPVTIAPDDFERWLDCRGDHSSGVMDLLAAPRENNFVWHPVSTQVNRVVNDDAQLILPMTEEELAAADMAATQPAPARKRKAEPTVSSDDGQGSLF
jgi:putative SOS response-associated peptidase YedK